MVDIQSTDSDPMKIIRREAYEAPTWLISHIDLDFDLGLSETRVHSRMKVSRQSDGAPLRLEGDGLEPLKVKVDGANHNDWVMKDGALEIALSGDNHVVETEVSIDPSSNSQLMGLYASNDMLCTQCESEGFRRITFFPDRPDVLSIYSVRMEGDKNLFPVLLSNGDLIDGGDADGDRHWAKWHDPFPKPSYLFALVAGDLVANKDSFTTMSGKQVDLAIYVRDGDLERTGHAMQALKNSMAWDEKVYGREYDLGLFNIVAVSDFNMGAMENKGLNVFNSRYILADPDVATDADYDGIEGVVAHEYFHNWSGNRVTCRDWFQLSLKEGFTVFRDQSFSADMGTPAAKRIDDVRVLRAAQFPEDAGPLAHPIRPESYMEISNFYTATVYNKGAEVIRMMATMLGKDRFRQGTDLYFDRHDGEAATCEDFVKAMEDGGKIDLGQFRGWYRNAGTPKVQCEMRHDAGSATVTLDFKQHISAAGAPLTPSEMVIPLRTALINAKTGEHRGEEMLVLDKPEQSFTFSGYETAPILSINRDFSAPIILETSRSAEDLAFLSCHDDDLFARFEAMQQLMVDILIARIGGGEAKADILVDAIRTCLADKDFDRHILAEIVNLPSEAFLGDQMLLVDPARIHGARTDLKAVIAKELIEEWRAVYHQCSRSDFSLESGARADRRMQNVALSYIVAAEPDEGAKLAFAQFEAANNMTSRQGALSVLSLTKSPERDAAFAAFYARYKDNALVLDKWFTLQAMSPSEDTLAEVERLSNHPDFTLTNPNRVRALYAGFAANQVRLHDVSGKGYEMLADLIIELDKQNPQTAARFVPTLGRWRRFEAGLSQKMRGALERIAKQDGLSKDVSEQVIKSLG